MGVTMNNSAFQSVHLAGQTDTMAAFNVPEQPNRYLLAAVACWSGNDQNAGASVTYNGVTMTPLGSPNFSNWHYGDSDILGVYGLVAPATGSHDFGLTFFNVSENFYTFGAISLCGVDQVVPANLKQGSTIGGANTFNLRGTARAGCLAFDFFCGEVNGSSNAVNDGSQTILWNTTAGPGQYGGASWKNASYPTVTSGWIGGLQSYYSYALVVVNPADPVRWGVA